MLVPQAELSSLAGDQDTSGRDLIDVTIVDIAVGNSSDAAQTWIQPGGEEFSAHNIFVKGQFLYISYYVYGLNGEHYQERYKHLKKE